MTFTVTWLEGEVEGEVEGEGEEGRAVFNYLYTNVKSLHTKFHNNYMLVSTITSRCAKIKLTKVVEESLLDGLVIGGLVDSCDHLLGLTNIGKQLSLHGL